jgi:hypothetical protein
MSSHDINMEWLAFEAGNIKFNTTFDLEMYVIWAG